MKKQNMNKHYQKQNIKKEYAAARNAGGESVTDLADGFVCLKLQLAFALGLFQLILKMKAGFALAGFLKKERDRKSVV